MNLTKNAKGELYDGVQKKEKWVKYLMQWIVWGCLQKRKMGYISYATFTQEKPNPTELKSLIHWTETTSIKPKIYLRIIEDTSWRTSNAVNY